MDSSPNLTLPYIIAAQAQKHVTHNEAIRALDALVQLMVLDKDLASPPGSPADGNRYIVAASPTGAWAGQAGKVAAYQDGTWEFFIPRKGWLAWVADEDRIYAHNGTAWAELTVSAGSGATTWGINATADTTNRLAVKSTASLFDNVGAGHQQKINKNAAGDTASTLYQTNYSGRAEFGLTGDDDFHVKVSPDGSVWYDAIIVDRSSGAARFPKTSSINDGPLAGFRNRIVNGSCAISQRYAAVATAIADNAYWADRWRYIGEASATCTGRDTTFGGAYPFNGAIKFTGTADKGGLFQVIEGIGCRGLAGLPVTGSIVLAVSNTRLGNIKMGIVEWTGTEDAVSGDPVSSWGADGVTPTLAAGWAFLNTPANLAVTTSPVRYAVSATCGGSTKNLALMVWNDDKSYNANDTLYFARADLSPGSVAPLYAEARPYSIELGLCQRFFQKSWAQGTAVGTAWSAGFDQYKFSHPSASFASTWSLPGVMRTSAPTFTVYDHLGASGKVTYFASGAWNAGGAITSQLANDTMAFVQHIIGSSVFTNFGFTLEADL
jgi:hypothetical protein